MDELWQYYESRQNEEPSKTKQTARESIGELEKLLEKWEDDRLGALILDLGMILYTKRGISGKMNLAKCLQALEDLVMVFHARDKARKSTLN